MLSEAFVGGVLRPDPGARVVGFKEIRFHAEPGFFWPYLNFIYENFPNVRFIFNTRNHADVAKSGWWAKDDRDAVLRVLEQAETLFAGYRRHFPDRCHHVHYDDYVADFQCLQALFAFLGEEWNPGVVEQVMGQRLEHLQSRT